MSDADMPTLPLTDNSNTLLMQQPNPLGLLNLKDFNTTAPIHNHFNTNPTNSHDNNTTTTTATTADNTTIVDTSDNNTIDLMPLDLSKVFSLSSYFCLN